jgi:hypothetical protein
MGSRTYSIKRPCQLIINNELHAFGVYSWGLVISSGLRNPRDIPNIVAKHNESILNGALIPLTKLSVGWRINVQAVENTHSLLARFVRVELK